MQPPLDINRLFARAEQAFLAGRLDAARQDLLEVRRQAGPHPIALHLLALVEAKRGDVPAAREAFEAALKGAPRDAQIIGNFANFLADCGDAAGALDQYARALAAAPQFHDARLNRALLLHKLGRQAEALADLDTLASARPRDARVHSARGSVLRDLDRLAEAAAAYDAALAAEPDRATAAIGRARVAMERGEDATPALYRRALALRPGSRDLQLDLAEALEMAGDPDAVPTLAAAVAAEPSWANGQKALARMRWEAGEGRAFTRDLERALQARPRDRDLWVAYASALAEADLNAEAADAAAGGRAAVGDDPTLVLLEAVRASEAGQSDRADRMFALAPAGTAGRHSLEARHRIRCGDYGRAAALTDQARAETPWDIGTWALTGLLWRLTGDPRAHWLLEQPGLVDTSRLPFDDGEIDALAAHLRGLHRTRAHPIGQSLRGGTQTRGHLFERAEPEIRRLKRAIEAAVGDYWRRLPPPDAKHPLLRLRDHRPRLKGSWSVRLTGGGYHVAHFHPQGALSSACYFVVPEPERPMEGWLELGGPPGGLDVPIEPLARIEPAPGRMALFPSYLFHGTRPFSGGERLTVAFDVAA
ncbi:MAG TPA: putative 2OG-Fe(II) oxygenase [Allosphingosinicella sp.]|jgi:tetratricopeptide (TPR) repeat protein